MSIQKSASFALVCAPAGSGFRESVARLNNLLKKTLGGDAIAFADVEDVLCSSAKAAEALEGKIFAGHRITMREVTWNLTRDQVIELWQSALADAITQLQRAQGTRVKLLACHLNLYGGKRKEFYSPLDVSRLKQAEISHLLLMIDDIFDMYARLTTYGHLYDEEKGIQRHIRGAWEDEGKEGNPRFTEDVTRALSLEWRLQVLGSLLSWRHSEMILAESLASQLGAHYLVFGTKQIAKVVSNWLQNPTGDSVYLSHPISRPRRTKRETGSWPAVVTEFNRLQRALLDEGVTSIMPTAIDEFRLMQGPRGGDADLRPRLPILESRWPLPSNDLEEILYTSPEQDAPEYTNRLMPREHSNELSWYVWLRSLESQIKAEIPFRDHHLVVCNRDILIYRPCYQTGHFSEGVEAEVKHWSDLRQLDNRRRAVFLHFDEDLLTLMENLTTNATYEGLVHQQLTAVLERRGLSEPVAKLWSSAILTGSGESLLDAGADLAQVRQEQQEFLVQAHIETLGNKLTAGQLDNPGVAVWLLDDSEKLFHAMPEIAGFLRGEQAAPTNWQAKCLDQLRAGGRDL